MKKPTSADVAKAAGVSKWTVIRAFTPGASITDASRKKVLEEAEKLGYVPNLLARSLATNQTNQVAVLVDDFANMYKLPALEALTQQLQQEGMAAVLININHAFDHLTAVMNAEQRQVDAIVLLGTAFRPEILQSRKSAAGAPPLFVLARSSLLEDIPSIDCDPGIAMHELCEHLYQKGYRRPVYLSGPDGLSTGLGRYQGVQAFWQQRGKAEVERIQASEYAVNAAKRSLIDYLSKLAPDSWPDVMICENDTLAIGVMDALRQDLGVSVPARMAVTGFDGSEVASLAAYGITSYAQPMQEMVATLVAMIKGRKPAQSVSLTGQLLPRQSA